MKNCLLAVPGQYLAAGSAGGMAKGCHKDNADYAAIHTGALEVLRSTSICPLKSAKTVSQKTTHHLQKSYTMK